MKKILCVLTSLIFLSSVHCAQQNNRPLNGISFFSPRSQSAHAERKFIGIHPFLYHYNYDELQTIIDCTFIYSQSVRPKRIAQALFGKDTLIIAGSNVINNTNHDLLADNFGLSPSFSSTVQFKPFIRNFLCDIQVIFLLDSIKCGLYFSINAPVGFTRWDLKIKNENIFDNGIEIPFGPGYQSANSIPLISPFTSFEQAIKGNIGFGAINEGIQKGKITHSHTKKGFADMNFTVGYNIIAEADFHVCMYGLLTAPTGSRPKSEFLMEPILGNGKHWQTGIGLNAHTLVWEKLEQELNVYTDISFCHIFGAKQYRSFDFIGNGFASRYLLLKEFDQTGAFTGAVVPAINVTTLLCNVSNDLQVDTTFMLGYTYNDFVFDIGYNGWIRSKEKIKLNQCLPENKYGIKGIQNVFDPITQKLDNTTQSTATIAGNFINQKENLADTVVTFVNTHDLSLHSAASARLITHKIFFYAGYAWSHCEKNYGFTPFFGASFNIEFEGINERDTFQSDKNTLAQWFACIKAGIKI